MVQNKGGGWKNPFSQSEPENIYPYRSYAVDSAMKYFMAAEDGETEEYQNSEKNAKENSLKEATNLLRKSKIVIKKNNEIILNPNFIKAFGSQ